MFPVNKIFEHSSRSIISDIQVHPKDTLIPHHSSSDTVLMIQDLKIKYKFNIVRYGFG